MSALGAAMSPAALSKAGYAPLVTGAPEDLSALLRAERPRLVLLDLVLPGTDGIELLERVPELAEIPVIFISGYGRDETIARAFAAGAADHVVKPFSPTELVARVGAALRRREEPEPFVLGDLAVRYDRREATVAGRAVDLAATEYELLRVLSPNAGRVVPFDTLLERVWAGRSGAPTRTACGWSSSSCATSSATAPTIRAGSSTGAASATAWRSPAGTDCGRQTGRTGP